MQEQHSLLDYSNCSVLLELYWDIVLFKFFSKEKATELDSPFIYTSVIQLISVSLY